MICRTHKAVLADIPCPKCMALSQAIVEMVRELAAAAPLAILAEEAAMHMTEDDAEWPGLPPADAPYWNTRRGADA